MPTCCVIGCISKCDIYAKRNGISFHRFPKDEEIARAWFDACKRVKLDGRKDSWTSNHLCSLHFKEECFVRSGSTRIRRLYSTAIPSIFEHVKIKRELVDQVYSHYDQVSVSSDEPRTSSYDFESQTELRQTKREKRLRLTVTSLVDQLRQKFPAKEKLLQRLQLYKDIPLDSFGNDENTYSKEMWEFCITLNLYCGNGYELIRSYTPLPHSCVIRRWLTCEEGGPGFSRIALEHLLKSKSARNGLQYRYCTMIVDYLPLKEKAQWDMKTGCYLGFINLGNEYTTNDDELATEALVFMAVGIFGNWKCPFAYFLIKGLSSSIKTELIIHAIHLLGNVGVCVKALTLSGHKSNLRVLKKLGCNFDAESPISSFKGPLSSVIYAFINPRDCLKLVRNIFAKSKTIEIPGIGTASWTHIVRLQQLLTQGQLKSSRKLDLHMKYKQLKMKVAIVSQTLSLSVATALQFVSNLGYDDFEDIDGTVSLLRTLGKLCEILSSRSLGATGLKAPVMKENFFMKQEALLKVRKYLLSLATSEGIPVVQSVNSIGLIGLVMCVQSLLSISESLLWHPLIPSEYILPQKFTHDHLEIFFNAVRGSVGWNSDPTAKQLADVYRRFLAHVEIEPDSWGNCINFTVGSNDDAFDVIDHFANEPDFCSKSDYVDDVVVYTAGFAVRKILRHELCSRCRYSLIDSPTSVNRYFVHRHFIRLKDGNLLLPSENVVSLLKTTETLYRRLPNLSKNKPERIFVKLFDYLPASVFASNEMHESGHRLKLIRSLLCVYCEFRSRHVT